MKKKKTKKVYNPEKNGTEINIGQAYPLKFQESKKFEIPEHPTLSLIIRIAVIIFLILIFIGMIIGYLFNTKQSVSLASISLAIILFFFSNTLLPLEIMSSTTRKVLLYNPFVMGESILKKILLIMRNM